MPVRVYYFDDAGDRSGDPARPFFVLGGFGIDADHLPDLKKRIQGVAARHQFWFHHPSELKFSHVGRNSDNNKRRPHWMIRSGLASFAQRRALVNACLREFVAVPTVKIIAIAVDQTKTFGTKSPIVQAIEPLFERISFDCMDHNTHGLVICDEEQADDKKLRDATRSGTFYMRFGNLVDTISFMPSEESVGVQVADLIAGSFSRYLNSQDPGYVRILWPALRSSAIGQVNGYGVKVFPSGTCVPPDPPAELSRIDLEVAELESKARGKEETGGR
ncbi:DUF3800 domain-containing protein [Mycobacteroides abscessus]|nr:DUF3800 domain-containing protein [Mycobacteroides abscessus]